MAARKVIFSSESTLAFAQEESVRREWFDAGAILERGAGQRVWGRSIGVLGERAGAADISITSDWVADKRVATV